jgi:hypothetical protein
MPVQLMQMVAPDFNNDKSAVESALISTQQAMSGINPNMVQGGQIMQVFAHIKNNLVAANNFQVDVQNWVVDNTTKVQNTFLEVAQHVKRKADISTVEMVA